ncbi:PTS N-acetylgalactosamine transporter subunit IIB, partial [Staphylococcus aureus]|nr:PTS N-acetylgalactosamine transporter subunit IIB [Staphylococcus aureus]
DVDAFKKLQELGVKLSIQRVPSTPEESLDALFS